VIQEHENRLDTVSRSELARWLQADPRHRSAYEEACEIWLACALLPPVPSDPDNR
jgi:transmembrane sensor